MAIKTRQTTATGVTNNNAPLTNAELDNNFVELQQNKVDASGDTITGDLRFASNVNAIFGGGATDYLNIYSDGTNKYIQDTGGGSLFIRGSDLVLEDASGHDYIAMSDTGTGGTVEVKHGGSTKLSTSSTGVDVTGEVKADKFTNDEALPDVRPSLLLDFANSGSLDPRLTFTRGSTAKSWDGKSRFKANENLIQYSNDITQTGWSTGRLSSTQDETAPDGTTTAWTIEQTDLSTGGYIRNDTIDRDQAVYCYSFYVKYVDWAYIKVTANGTVNYVVFNLTNGTVAKDGSGGETRISHFGIEAVDNTDWYRIYVAGPEVGDTPHIYFTNSEGSTAVAANTKKYIAWGWQLEEDRTSPTAYTATTGEPLVNWQPKMVDVPVDTPRFEIDPATGKKRGLLIEKAATNHAAYSESLNSWSKTNITVLNDVTYAPDGTKTAEKLVPNTADSNHYIQGTYSGISGRWYTFSFFAKSAQDGFNSIWCFTYRSSGNFPSAFFNLETGTKDVSGGSSTVARIYDVGNGWYRCAVTFQADANETLFFRTYVADGTDYSPVGNYYSGVYAWGYQFEENKLPTSYISNNINGSTTRVSEYLYAHQKQAVTGTYLNPQRGAMNIEAEKISLDNNNSDYLAYLSSSRTGAAYHAAWFWSGEPNKLRYKVVDNYSRTIADRTNTVSDGPFNYAVTWSIENGIAQSVNGSASTYDTTGNMPYAIDRLYIGGTGVDTNNFNGYISKFALYDEELTTDQLSAVSGV